MPLWLPAEFYKNFLNMIAVALIVYLNHRPLKKCFFIKPYEVSVLLKYKSFLALLKLMIKEIKEIHKQ